MSNFIISSEKLQMHILLSSSARVALRLLFANALGGWSSPFLSAFRPGNATEGIELDVSSNIVCMRGLYRTFDKHKGEYASHCAFLGQHCTVWEVLFLLAILNILTHPMQRSCETHIISVTNENPFTAIACALICAVNYMLPHSFYIG